MATIDTGKRRTEAQRRHGLPQPTFPWARLYVKCVDTPRPLGKFSNQPIYIKGGSSTTIRLDITNDDRNSFVSQN